MRYDVIIIGAGLSGLSAASLLAKRGLHVAVIEHAFKPGGSCGIFKRAGATFDQGSAMMFGFGEKGFNGHRFLFNALGEPIDVIRHESLYSVYYRNQRIDFHYDIDRFIESLSQVFPEERDNLKRFYHDMDQIYHYVIADQPTYSTPDEVEPKEGLKQLLKHPLAYARFLSYLNLSARKLLKRYFQGEEILDFFDKLTSTYCYTTVAETPAVLAAVMFVDNHVGGSFYPAGSTIMVPGLLEKVIEENGGDMLYEQTVERILIEDGRAKGVVLDSGETLAADRVIFSGTVWNLYGKLIDPGIGSPSRRQWAAGLRASYPSVILYALVKKDVIPEGTTPITLFTANNSQIDDNEVTAYILSIDDASICPEGTHTVAAIGPTFRKWPAFSDDYQSSPVYQQMKLAEEERLLNVMEQRFKGFRQAVIHSEVSTPLSIERYTLKNNGSVAGPTQSMGQHMLRRLHIRSEFTGLYCCGESTIMGTGTPAVTVSGITAANAILKDLGLERFVYRADMKNFVREIPPRRTASPVSTEAGERGPSERMTFARDSLQAKAACCDYCEHPTCMSGYSLDIRGINRRLAVGNVVGAHRLLQGQDTRLEALEAAQRRCIHAGDSQPVLIAEIIRELSMK